MAKVPSNQTVSRALAGTSRPFKQPLTNSGRMHDSRLIPQRPSAFDRVGAAGYSQDRSIEGSAGGGKQSCCRSDCGPAARSDPLFDRSGMAGETGTRNREQSPSALGLAPSKASDTWGRETWSTEEMMYVSVPCQNATTHQRPARKAKATSASRSPFPSPAASAPSLPNPALPIPFPFPPASSSPAY